MMNMGIDVVTNPEPTGALRMEKLFSKKSLSNTVNWHNIIVGEEHGCGGGKLDHRLGIPAPIRPIEQAELIGCQMNVSEQLFGSLA